MEEVKQLNVAEKLQIVQSKLRAPKNAYNSFGKYYFRNSESILKAVKPLLKEVGAIVTMADKVVFLENRYYVEVTSSFIDIETREFISTTASAREEETKKGMDSAMITGGSSSYARKYSLSGLFLIDDNKDPDMIDPPAKPKAQPKAKSSVARDEVLKYIKDNSLAMTEIAKEFKLSHNTTDEVYISTLEALKARA